MTLTFEISNHECDENKKKGVLAHKSIVTWFIRGMGGFGFAGTGFAKPYPKIPKREPCAIWEEKTEKN